MINNALVQIGLYVVLLTVFSRWLGAYIAGAMEGRPAVLGAVLGPVERAIYALAGVSATDKMDWRKYLTAIALFNGLGLAVLFVLLLAQGYLPLNPEAKPGLSIWLAANTAISFVTNTNWQAYSGEVAMSYFSQMAGLAVQNFLSAATGIAVLAAVVRGLGKSVRPDLGSFWVDVTRATLYILLPLALLLACVLVSQGVAQTFQGSREVKLLEPYQPKEGAAVTVQKVPLGPAASQVAIKQLGTNGGGFYNTNSAHPIENPTPVSNFLQTLAILLIPGALCFTFGHWVQDKRQGVMLYCVMLAIFVGFLTVCLWAEQTGVMHLARAGADVTASDTLPGGNMEGKEARFGIVDTALFATATTAASCGAVNGMHDSFTPIGGMVPLLLIQLGEVVFGGVGSGLYGMLAFVVVTVFLAGLMVGRTPEFLGKKIDAFEMQMASLVVLIPCAATLLGTALACMTEAGRAGMSHAPPHGFTQILYAVSSAANNNGSAFGGMTVDTPFYNTLLGALMVIGRFGVMVPLLALAGSMVKKKYAEPTPGVLPTHTPVFGTFLVAVVLIVGALTYVPALVLGPVAEHLEAGPRVSDSEDRVQTQTQIEAGIQLQAPAQGRK
jgi:potassium-transporting ATPase potassium-binding subunit